MDAAGSPVSSRAASAYRSRTPAAEGRPGDAAPDVRLDDRGQQRGAGQAVRHVRGPADHAGQAVHGAELGVGQRHPAEQAAHGHVRPRGQVAAVGVGGAQARPRAAQPFAGQPVGQRGGLDRHERLQALGERVQAAGRGDRRRARDGEQRVDQRDPGDHQRAAQAGLEPVRREASTALAVTSAPVPAVVGTATQGTAGRVIGLAGPDDLQVVQRVTAVAQQHGHGLAGVDDAAAADGGDDVGAVLAAAATAARASSTVGSAATGNTAAASPRPASSPACRAGSPPVQQHPGAEPGEHARQLRRPAGTGQDAGRRWRTRIGAVTAGRSPSLHAAGNTTENLVDARGSAIISATASRQAA